MFFYYLIITCYYVAVGSGTSNEYEILTASILVLVLAFASTIASTSMAKKREYHTRTRAILVVILVFYSHLILDIKLTRYY